METLTGVELDVTKSSNLNWVMYFTGGVYETTNAIKTIEPFVIKLQPKDYDSYPLGSAWNIYYDYASGSPYLVQVTQANETDSCNTSVEVGGFMLADGCQIKFLQPSDACVVYNRLFDTDYDSDFDSNDSSYDACEPCAGAFNSDFSEDLNVFVCSPGV